MDMADDRMSELPCDILISIICRLTLREATATSLLSSRWRYLHSYGTHLDMRFIGKRLSSEDYIKIVDRVMDSHRGSQVKVFKVQTNKASLQKCLHFAFTKEAEIIYIWNMDGDETTRRISRSRSRSRRNELIASRQLREVCLCKVKVSGQDIQHLVSHSVALESLSIQLSYSHTKHVEAIKLIGHPKLKHFNISFAWRLGSIEIRDMISLVSMKLFGVVIDCAFHLSNLPNFTQLSYRDMCGDLPQGLFARMPPSIRDQLQLFHLSTNLRFPMDYQVLEILNVKRLELELDMHDNILFLSALHPLIEACQYSLENLKIKFLWKVLPNKEVDEDASYKYYDCGSYRTTTLFPNLKEVEILGYCGSPQELDLASYVINNAGSLQELVVIMSDHHSPMVNPNALARAKRIFQRMTAASSANFLICNHI